MLLETLAQVRELVEDVGFARNIESALGTSVEPVVVKGLYAAPDLDRGFSGDANGALANATLEGWKVTWHLQKADVRSNRFTFTVSAFIPCPIAKGRALEIILGRFRAFLEHELREGFLVRHERPFDPHGSASELLA